MPDPRTSLIRQLQAIVEELRLLEEMYLKGGNSLEAGIGRFHDIWAHVPKVSKQARKKIIEYSEIRKLCIQITYYGKYYLDLEGNPKQNLQLYKESLRLARLCGDKEMEAMHLSFIGEVLDVIGKSRIAINYHHQALQIAESIDDIIIKGTALYGLSWSYYYQNDYIRALEYCRRSLDASQTLGIQREISHDLATMGLIYIDLGDIDIAIETLKKALVIDRTEGDSIAEGATMGCLGEAYLRKGDFEAAKENILEAIAIEKKLMDTPNLIDHLLVLGKIYLEQGLLLKSIKTLDDSLELSLRMMRGSQQASTKELLSQVYYEIGDMEKAVDLLASAARNYTTINSKQATILNKKLLSWKMRI